METMEKALTAEYKGANPRLFFTKTPVAADEIEAVLSVKETKALIQFLILMPQGVMEMNGEVPGVVQTPSIRGKQIWTSRKVFLQQNRKSAPPLIPSATLSNTGSIP